MRIFFEVLRQTVQSFIEVRIHVLNGTLEDAFRYCHQGFPTSLTSVPGTWLTCAYSALDRSRLPRKFNLGLVVERFGRDPTVDAQRSSARFRSTFGADGVCTKT